MSETKSRRQEAASVLSDRFNAVPTGLCPARKDQVYRCVCVFLSCGHLPSVLFLLHTAASLLKGLPSSQTLAQDPTLLRFLDNNVREHFLP